MRRQEIAKLHKMYTESVRETIKQDVSEAIVRMNPDFWKEINGSLITEMRAVVHELHEILLQGFNAPQSERDDFVENFKLTVKNETNSYVIERSKNLNDDILRKFKHAFERNEKGVVRDWVAMEVDAIKELWLVSYNDCAKLIDSFRTIQIDYDDMVTTTGGPEDGQIGEQQAFRRRASAIEGKLLSEAEVNRCKDRFREDAEKL